MRADHIRLRQTLERRTGHDNGVRAVFNRRNRGPQRNEGTQSYAARHTFCTCSSSAIRLHGQELDDSTGALVERGALLFRVAGIAERHEEPALAAAFALPAARALITRTVSRRGRRTVRLGNL